VVGKYRNVCVDSQGTARTDGARTYLAQAKGSRWLSGVRPAFLHQTVQISPLAVVTVRCGFPLSLFNLNWLATTRSREISVCWR